MNDVRYDVIFRAALPEGIAIGDKLQIEGTVTVRAIEADLVDISGHGAKEYAVGETRVGLYSNRLDVKIA